MPAHAPDRRRAEALEAARVHLADHLARIREAPVGTADPPERPAPGPAARRALPGAGAVVDVREAASLQRPGRSSRELVDEALQRIERLDHRFRAWVTVDADGARTAASGSDARAAQGRRRSALDGVPVGIKDLIDTAGMRTTYGSTLFADHVPERDADVVARLRRSGAVVLGKTVTTEFATYDPGPTRNPWHEAHTPGGSSSGSAAAVAAGMVPVAIGTQTGGSTIRPASYCGVVGYIPTAGWISRAGIFPCSWALDRVGLFGRSVADVALLLDSCLRLRSAGTGIRATAAHRGAEPSATGRVAIVEPLVRLASPAMHALTKRVATLLSDQQVAVWSVDVPFLDDLHAAHVVIMWTEIAAVHADLYARNGGSYGPRIAAIVEAGRSVPAVDYLRAMRLRRRLLVECRKLLARFDALVAPAAVGEAEATLATIGEPTMNLFATFAGCPAITVPVALSDAGMPLGVQLMAAPGRDARLLAMAASLEAAIAFVRPELPRPAALSRR